MNHLDGGDILDLATGRGGFLGFLCEHFSSYKSAAGIDSNEKSVSAAREGAGDKKFSFEVMDCTDLKFSDSSFDVVSISNSLHHFREREKVLSEALRVLKTGGLLIISEMFHSPDERPSQSTHSEFHHWWGEIDSALGIYHDKTFTRDELLEIVRGLPVSSMEFEQIDGVDEDIHSEEIRRELTGAFEAYKGKAGDLDSPERYIKRGEALLKKLERDGFAPSSRLEILCTK